MDRFDEIAKRILAKGADMSLSDRLTEIAKGIQGRGEATTFAKAYRMALDRNPELGAESAVERRGQQRPAVELRKKVVPPPAPTKTWQTVLDLARQRVAESDGSLTLPKAVAQVWAANPDAYRQHQAEARAARISPRRPPATYHAN